MEKDTFAIRREYGWEDRDGLIASIRPGDGGRASPVGEVPTGPAVASRFPDVRAARADGEPFDLHEFRAGRGAVVHVFRSAVWCPSCRTQLVDLQSHLAAFEDAGVVVVALSYDEPDALAAFAAEFGITYPLLSDPDSAVIASLGILNTLVDPDDHPWYGIPFPGSYVLDPDGVVTATFFESNLAMRAGATQLLDAATGRRLEITPRDAPVETVEVEVRPRVVAAPPGRIADLDVVLRVPAGQHLRSDVGTDGVETTTVSLDADGSVVLLGIERPPTRAHRLAGTGDTIDVHDGDVGLRVRFAHVGRNAQRRGDTHVIAVAGTVHWQACDDDVCHPPGQQRFTFDVVSERLLRPGIDDDDPERMSFRDHFARLQQRRS